MNAGVKTGEFTVTTSSDSNTSYERNGIITATIRLSNESILVASVEVIDDDVPIWYFNIE